MALSFDRVRPEEPGLRPTGNFATSPRALRSRMRSTQRARPACNAARVLAFPWAERGPVERPPWRRHRHFPGIANRWQKLPRRVLAPQRLSSLVIFLAPVAHNLLCAGKAGSSLVKGADLVPGHMVGLDHERGVARHRRAYLDLADDRLFSWPGRPVHLGHADPELLT